MTRSAFAFLSASVGRRKPVGDAERTELRLDVVDYDFLSIRDLGLIKKTFSLWIIRLLEYLWVVSSFKVFARF